MDKDPYKRQKTTSSYLGWTERKPKGFHDKFDHNSLPGGLATKSYESMVKGLFLPGKKIDHVEPKNDHGVSAYNMLKVERQLGKYALESCEDEDLLMKTPLERMYIELGLQCPELRARRQDAVYKPKSSYEYLRTKFAPRPVSPTPKRPPTLEELDKMPANIRHYSMMRDVDDEDWKKNNRQQLIDYKEFDSSPLSPYLYQEHPYVRNQDSRIVCSNFVQVTSRPKDRFLDKIDRTLAEVRAMPRYT